MEWQFQRRMEIARGNASCPDWEELLIEAIPPAEESEHREHFAECPECRSELGWMRHNLPDYNEFNKARLG
jgi:hypothetical protein